MTRTVDVPRLSRESVVASGRLGAYLYAALAARDRGQRWIPSTEIADVAGVHATVVRRDLSTVLGRAGKRGVGYRPTDLIAQLRDYSAGAARHLVEAARRPDRPELKGSVGFLIQEAASLAIEIEAAIARLSS